MKTLIHPVTGQEFKMGRTRSTTIEPKMQLRDYFVGPELPTPPDSVSYTAKAPGSRGRVFCNDTLSCCTCSGYAHIVGVLTGNAGKEFVATDPQVIALYHGACGYIPGQPNTDQGGNEDDVLAYLQKNGAFGGHKIYGHLAIQANNVLNIRRALWLFENLYFGVELPAKWVDPMPSGDGFVWGVDGPPDEDNGHCFIGDGYDKDGVDIDSWGILGKISYPAIARYATRSANGALYALVSADTLNRATKKSPNGLDWIAMLKDFQAMSH